MTSYSPRKARLALKVKCLNRPGGYVVLAGTQEDLKNGLGLPIAQFAESITPTLYQSRHDAKRRAKVLLKALTESGEFE